MKMEDTATVVSINSLQMDSILRMRQSYTYKHLPEIAKNSTRLTEYADFIPIHMEYWDLRNKTMAQNILKHIQKNPNAVIVVLNGFYHRYYLLDELKKYETEYNFSVQ